MRTLMFAANLDFEGAAFSQFELTAWLRRQGGLEPWVCAAQDGPLRQLYEEAEMPVAVLDMPGSRQLENGYDIWVKRLAEEMQRVQAQVVYANTWKAFIAIDAARIAGIPSLWNLRDSLDWPECFLREFGAELTERALACFSYPFRIIFVAHATRRLYEPLNTAQNYMTLHNGLDRQRLYAAMSRLPRKRVRQELGLAPGELALLTVGTVCERKGQLDLILALPQLPLAVQSRIRIFLIGGKEDEYNRNLQEACARLPEPLRDRVNLVAETHDTAQYYAAADLFVFCSRNESFPRVILEAMACRLPIVTTPVFGIAEQVEEGVNALLYQPGDIEALADCIGRLVADDKLRQKFAENSTTVLDRINDYDEMARRYAAEFAAAGAAPNRRNRAGRMRGNG